LTPLLVKRPCCVSDSCPPPTRRRPPSRLRPCPSQFLATIELKLENPRSRAPSSLRPRNGPGGAARHRRVRPGKLCFCRRDVRQGIMAMGDETLLIAVAKRAPAAARHIRALMRVFGVRGMAALACTRKLAAWFCSQHRAESLCRQHATHARNSRTEHDQYRNLNLIPKLLAIAHV
jgi:hypothetical protein